jgi:hypothetical protein
MNERRPFVGCVGSSSFFNPMRPQHIGVLSQTPVALSMRMYELEAQENR